MADNPSTRLAEPSSPVVNGFPRLTTAAPPGPSPQAVPGSRTTAASPAEPGPAAGVAPTPHPAPTPSEPSAGVSVPTPYSYNPDVLAEHALLGSLLYAPRMLPELESFLGVRDFGSPETRAVFATIRGLYASGALFDVAALPTEGQRMDAANENRLRLFTALRATPSPFTDIAVSNLPQLLNTLAVAAPPECLPFRGVYDQGAQLRLGRMVLEDSCRRQLQSMGVLLRRTEPLVTPAQQHVEPGVRQAENLGGHLEVIQNQLRAMTDRLIAATRSTGPDLAAATAQVNPSRRADVTAARAETRRWRLPAPIRVITEHRLRRAERALIHLALNCGPMTRVPPEIMALRPEDFTHPQHANTWRTIRDLHHRGIPVNYVSVFHALRSPTAPQPSLPDRALLRMATPPDLKPERVAAALATVTTAGLTRATQRAGRTLAAVAAAGPTLAAGDALDHVTRDITALAARATTAGARHHTAQPTSTPRPATR